MSAGDGLQPDVLWGQDSGAGGDRLLLAAPLVPGHPGARTGGNSMHHHHLHPEGMMSLLIRAEPAVLFGLCSHTHTQDSFHTDGGLGLCCSGDGADGHGGFMWMLSSVFRSEQIQVVCSFPCLSGRSAALLMT